MPDLDSLFAAASVVGDEDESIEWLEIDHDFRRITIPSTKQLLGVTSDEKVNVIRFKCPRVCSEVDLSDFDFRINYRNAGQEGDMYLVADKKVTDDTITFSWLVDRHACMYAGSVSFSVCAKLFDENNTVAKEYNTAIHQLTVAEGLETIEDITSDFDAHTDVIEQFLQNAQTLYEITDTMDALRAIVDGIELELLRKVDGGYVQDGYLFLTSNGTIVVGPLGPFSGGGGSGGGGGETIAAVFTASNTTGWLSKTIASSSKCPISITWSSIEDGLPTGSGTLAINVNNVDKAILTVDQGEVIVDLAPYCSNGKNTCTVRISDVYGQSRPTVFTIMKEELKISSSLDTSTVYRGPITVPYVPTGSVVKTVYFVVDGEVIGTQYTSVSAKQMSYVIPKQEHGAHTLKIYFEATINGEVVRSNELFFEFTCVSEEDESPVISSSFSTETVNQYDSVVIPFRVYDPTSDSAEVQIYVNEELVSTQTVDRTEQSYTYRANTPGEVTVLFISGIAEKTIRFTVNEVNIDVEAETEDLVLYLNAQGRSNNEETRASWKYNDISATFTDFNWRLDGWLNDDDGIDVLRLVDDARITIPYKLFGTDFKSTGKTIEIEFATRDVTDYSAPILTCVSDEMGLTITPQSIVFNGNQTKDFSTLYKDNEHIRLSMVFEKQTENRLILIYINGVMSRAIQYASGERFSQLSPVDISIGSNDCGIDLYNIRVYDNSLTRVQVLDNWIADTQIGELMMERYTRNQVYNASGDITIATLPIHLPYFILEAPELPQYKGDKKTISGSFTVPGNSARSFTFSGCQNNVQGTSSAIYYRKNYDLQFKEGFNTNAGNIAVYALRIGSIPFNRFVLKADVASSESANNTVLSMFFSDSCPYKTPAQIENPKVRLGIEGIPVVVFWYNPDDQTTTFLGKYNFNLPKRAPEPYGYVDGIESWEWERNNSANVKFQDDDFTSVTWDELTQTSYPTWYDDFEARYPSDEWRDYSKLKEFLSWVKSTWREAATNELLEEPVIYKLNTKTTVSDYSDDTSFKMEDEIVNGQSTGYTIFTFTKDTPAYRLTKFRAEFDQYAELQSAIYYYLFTEEFLMIDSRAKNMFIDFDGSEI